MLRGSLTGLDRKRLRGWLTVFFLALAIPTAILVFQAYSQIKWESFHQYRSLAEELTARIDSRLGKLVAQEESRLFTDYAFLVVEGDPSASFLQRSPLASFPVQSAVPGLIGYFQVDSDGLFTTPLLPKMADAGAFGVTGAELRQRSNLADRIRDILSKNRLVSDARASVEKISSGMSRRDDGAGEREETDKDSAAFYAAEPSEARQHGMDEEGTIVANKPSPGQIAFDQLTQAGTGIERKKGEVTAGTLGRTADLKLDDSYRTAPISKQRVQQTAPPVPAVQSRSARKEQNVLPEPETSFTDTMAKSAVAETRAGVRIKTFESEIDPFEFSILDSGHFVLFRKVWRDGQRFIQGALIEQKPFLHGIIQAAFRETALSGMSDLVVAYRGDILGVFGGLASRQYLSSADELRGALLYQARLSVPLSELELIFSINRMPAGPGTPVILWVSVLLTIVLCGGFYLMYRLGLGQIALARQQQDFVSAVSHELKTPLTSIRMYGEMLREGWVTEEKRKTYYDYIHDESERLSRLIENVLQLARMTRNDLQVNLKPRQAGELMDHARSRVSSQIQRAGFQADFVCAGAAGEAVVDVDIDLFTQVLINLVDNALKFAVRSEKKAIRVGCELSGDGAVLFSVRDFGPGIPRDQRKKIFDLFYRGESGLSRETAGTGIGLALVEQLVRKMGGQVDVENREPGAEFRVVFPSRQAPSPHP
jgi:signal transduction histidine kinase